MVDQECLVAKVQQWQQERPNTNIFFRPKGEESDFGDLSHDGGSIYFEFFNWIFKWNINPTCLTYLFVFEYILTIVNHFFFSRW